VLAAKDVALAEPEPASAAAPAVPATKDVALGEEPEPERAAAQSSPVPPSHDL